MASSSMIPGFSKLQMQGMVDDQEVEGRMRKVEAIINASSSQAHSNAFSALDEKEKRKYADLLIRASTANQATQPEAPPSLEQKQNLKGILEKNGDDLNLSVADEPSTEVQSPKNFTLQVGIKPQTTEQTVNMATGVNKNVSKIWGVTAAA